MSIRQGARAAAHRASAAGSAAARPPGKTAPRHGALASPATRIGRTRLSGYAWGTIGVTTAFIAFTCWWLTQDRSIPIYDAGDHLETAFLFHQMLRSGNLLGPLNYESPYPPFAALVGAAAVFIGGVHVAPPIIGENLIFVPLLTLGCYQTGRLLFDSSAGLLAAIFVLGSELLIAQLHVFMFDAPETAMVAISIWLILACDDFSRVRFAGVAGLAVGIGLVTKAQYPSFVVGILLMALLRGGWRNRRGLLTFAGVALIVGVPWYIDHLSQFSTFLQISTANPIVVPGDNPSTLSFANFTWYFWNILNAQLLLPLFVLLVGGTIWMILTLLRHRREALGASLSAGPSTGAPASKRVAAEGDARALGARLELFVGALVAWLFITATPSHDIRYGMPLMPYVAVIATGWISYLPLPARLLATAVVVLGVLANTLGITFGVGGKGGTVQVALVHPLPPGEQTPDAVTFYSDAGFLVSGPSRDGDVPGLLDALRHGGVRTVAWSIEQSRLAAFSFEGLLPLSRIAGLSPEITRTPEFSDSPAVATLIHLPLTASSPPTCTRLSDGTGVWVARYDPSSRKIELYCPFRHPQFYPGLSAG